MRVEDLQRCKGLDETTKRFNTHGYMAMVVSLVQMSLLSASVVLQVNGWGGWSLCLRQNSSGERLQCCRTSCRSDLAEITTHGVLLSMKYCCQTQPLNVSNQTAYSIKPASDPSDEHFPHCLKHTLYTLAQYSKERGLLMSYTRQTTSQARSASDRKSKSGITSWSLQSADKTGNRQRETECRWRD